MIIEVIAEEMTVNIDVSDVLKMMKNLKTQFLKEKRKVDDSKCTGKGTKDLYVSNWKFYSSLHFLLPFTRPMPTDSNILPGVEQRQLSIGDEDGDENEDADVDLLFDKTEDLASRAPLKSPRPYGNKNTRQKRLSPDDLILQASDVLASVAKKSELTSPNPPKLDSDELFGQSMARLVYEIPGA